MQEVYAILSYSQPQEVEENTYKPPCLELELSSINSINMQVSTTHCVLQKVSLQHQRVDLFS